MAARLLGRVSQWSADMEHVLLRARFPDEDARLLVVGCGGRIQKGRPFGWLPPMRERGVPEVGVGGMAGNASEMRSMGTNAGT